ncbi:1072_t:CDS:2, partial [Funneliformis geosporum]
KDTSQVQKLANNSYPEFTFKVINQFKGGKGKTDSGKRLSYQESFSTSGNYEHILEIEPVNLGIENFPPITRLVFDIDNLDWDSFQEKSTDNNLPTISPPSPQNDVLHQKMIIGIIMIVAILSLII